MKQAITGTASKVATSGFLMSPLGLALISILLIAGAIALLTVSIIGTICCFLYPGLLIGLAMIIIAFLVGKHAPIPDMKMRIAIALVIAVFGLVAIIYPGILGLA